MKINYSRQQMIPGLKVPESCVVIGAGGLGSWVALQLSMIGVPSITIFSRDNVQDSDLARFPFESSQVGKCRGEALKDIILKLRPDCSITLKGLFIPENTDHSRALTGPVFNCAAGPEGFDERVGKLCSEADVDYVSGIYSNHLFGVFSEPVDGVEPSTKPVGCWTPTLASASAGMIHAVMVQKVSFISSFSTMDNPADVKSSLTKMENLPAR